MKKQVDTYNEIYNRMEIRLNQIGEIRTSEVWTICKLKYGYSTIVTHFRKIMTTMVEQGKAVKIKNGVWNILKPNSQNDSK